MDVLLCFEDVSYWYCKRNRRQEVFSDATITFERGKFYSIVGPSGSGKTTLLSLTCALDIPKEGRILYNGKDVADIGLTNFRNTYVSIVFQSCHLLSYMSGLQNVLTAMEITKTKVANPKSYALKMLANVGISEEESIKKVQALTPAQQQRIAIARALSCQSDLVVMDEPTETLDEEAGFELVKLFQKLAHEEYKCVIMATKNENMTKQSDTIIKLSNGNLTTIKNRGSEHNEKY